MFSSSAVVALAVAVQFQPPCTTSAPQVVDDIYKQVLERPADPASEGYSYALGYGEATVRDIVVRLAQSPEHLARFGWQPLIRNVYRQTLNRDPSPEEEDAAMRQLANRTPLRAVMARAAVRAARSEEEAVQLLYHRLLGRDPDPDGFRANVVLAQRSGVEAVMQNMMNSREYRMRAQQPAAIREDVGAYAPGVELMYRHLLARAPDPDGHAAMTQLAAVYGLAEVAHRIAASREYLERWGEYTVPGSTIQFCPVRDEGQRRAAPRPQQPRRVPQRFPSR